MWSAGRGRYENECHTAGGPRPRSGRQLTKMVPGSLEVVHGVMPVMGVRELSH